VDAQALELLRRNSGLSLDGDGTFFFKGEIVPNPRVQQLFHRGLDIRPSGEVTLSLGKVWAYVKTAGVARFVTSLVKNDRWVEIHLQDGVALKSECPRVVMGPANRFYLWEEADSYPAILLRRAHHELATLLEERVVGSTVEYGFTLAEHWIGVRASECSPGPADRA
jgi:hypothetical protein